jgi:hypothetical protein
LVDELEKYIVKTPGRMRGMTTHTIRVGKSYAMIALTSRYHQKRSAMAKNCLDIIQIDLHPPGAGMWKIVEKGLISFRNRGLIDNVFIESIMNEQWARYLNRKDSAWEMENNFGMGLLGANFWMRE